VDKISTVEDAVSLALAANEYLLEPLKTYCALKIEKMVTVNNVWLTLNSTCLIPKVAAACSKVIMYNFIEINVYNFCRLN